MPFLTTLRESLVNILTHPLGQALTNVLGGVLDKTMTPGDHRYIRFKLTGRPPLEDENLIRRARAELRTEDPNLDRELSRKLAKLPSHMQDYYRLAVVGLPDPDPARPKAEDDRYRIDEAKKAMRRDAEMTDPEWDQEIVNMNFNQPKADKIVTQIKAAFAKAGVKIANGAKAVKQVRSDLSTQFETTGLPDATGAVCKSLTDKIKNML